NVSTAFLPACGNVCGKESAALEQSPRRRNERICHALDEPNACGEKRSSNLDGDDRRGETNQAAGQNVGGIVDTDEHSTGADQGGGNEKERPNEPVEEEDGECNPEGSAGM